MNPKDKILHELICDVTMDCEDAEKIEKNVKKYLHTLLIMELENKRSEIGHIEYLKAYGEAKVVIDKVMK